MPLISYCSWKYSSVGRVLALTSWRPGLHFQHYRKQDMATHHSPLEPETGQSLRIWGHSGPQGEFQAGQNYKVRASPKLFFSGLFTLCVGECFPFCVSVYCVCIWCPKKSEEGIEFPGTGIPDGFEPSRGWWELNPDLLHEQQVPLPADLCL